jgi:hypothetical protein
MRVTVPFVEVYRISGERASAAPVKMYVDLGLRRVRLVGLDEKDGAERLINAPPHFFVPPYCRTWATLTIEDSRIATFGPLDFLGG